MTSTTAGRLDSLGLVLPEPPRPVRANCLPFKRAGDLIFVSGQGPRDASGAWVTGKVGTEVPLDRAQQIAASIALGLISLGREATGSLESFEFVRVTGMVNCDREFKDHPLVLNGCSDLLVAVLDDRGAHARSAVGVCSLPSNISLEIECIIRAIS